MDDRTWFVTHTKNVSLWLDFRIWQKNMINNVAIFAPSKDYIIKKYVIDNYTKLYAVIIT